MSVSPNSINEYGLTSDMFMVDCDAHFTEPADLWTARVPTGLADRVPVLTEQNGRVSWYLNGAPWASTGSNTIVRGRQKRLGSHVMDNYSDIDPSAWAVSDRLELMDEMGVHTEVIYPNGVGFASNHMFAIEDVEQRRLVLTIYNDFLVDLQTESKERLLPQAMLPIWDMDLTVKEMSRLLEQGIRGFTLSDKPELIGLPELWSTYYTPLWDLFNESGAVANFHIGSGNRRDDVERSRAQRGTPIPDSPKPASPPPGELAGYLAVNPAWSGFGPQRRLAVSATQSFMSNVRIISNFCYSDIFDRFPNLKIVSAESGIGWVPFLLEALDYQLSEMVTNTDEVAYAARRPSEYFRDHIWVMFWFEEVGPAQLLERIGVYNVLVETDVPHSTCLYPDPRAHLEKVFSNVPRSTVGRIVQGNAADLYRIDALKVPTRN
jgi:predicted TIM-barrel fold metal-dependent hydrolase